MFKFIRFIKYNTVPERIESKTRSLVLFGSKRAFRLFNDSDIRNFLNFSNLDQTEQDRMFNEMTVTNIVMLMLILDMKIDESDPGDKREYYKALRKKTPEYYAEFLKRSKVPEEFIEIWKKLIDLRYDEYDKGMVEWRDIFSKAKSEVSGEKGVMILQTVVFGLYDHLRRGNIKKEDRLYKYLQGALLGVYKGLMKKIG